LGHDIKHKRVSAIGYFVGKIWGKWQQPFDDKLLANLLSLLQEVYQAVRVVGDDPVDAQGDGFLHLLLSVYRPGVDTDSPRMRPTDI
jgi:hypothetical protein